MNLSDMVAVLEKADHPLQLALRIAGSANNSSERSALLVESLNRYGQRCDVAAIRQIIRFAQELYISKSEETRHICNALLTSGTSAAAWMRAAILEAEGCSIEAATLLGSLPDATWGEERAIRLLACAKNWTKAGHWTEAWGVLRESVKAASSYRTLTAADKLLGQLRKSTEVPCRRRCRIGLLGSTTLDLLIPVLRVVCFAHDIDVQIYQGPFGQYQQEILDPHSGLASFAPEVVIIATDWRTLGLPDETENYSAVLEEKVSILRNLWQQCRDRLNAFVIQHNFEIFAADPYGRLSTVLKGGRARLLRQINLELWNAEQEETGIAILDVDQIAAIYGKTSWSNPVLWHAAKQYPAPDAIPLLVRHQVALLRAVLGLTAKCLVLDLDGILWGGVIGEDGLSGIKLGGGEVGDSFVAFQHYIQSLQRRGIILAVCSKNNEEDAKLPFGGHPEMVLSLDDITMFVANWRSKDENLRLITETLNIGPDSLVLVDDNPAERAWVRQQLPEVEVPEMPDDPAQYIDAIDRQMYFETLSLTEEDRRRVEAYRENVQRRVLETTSASIEDFLTNLQMQVELKPFDEANLPRIAQLINKTNQFNLTTRRLSESQVRSLIDRPGVYTRSMRLRDRFGDNGLTGVLIALEENDTIRIDTWLMSCRVLGRRVEEAMLNGLLRYARFRGFRYVIGEYVPTAKNGLVSDLFERFGFECLGDEQNGVRKYLLNISKKASEEPNYFQIVDHT
jgi:FkbH-like protein